MKIKGRVGRGIYRAGKPVGTVGKVLKNRGRSVVPKSTFVHNSFGRVHLVVPRCTSAWSPMCSICRGCFVLLRGCSVLLRGRSVRKFKISKIPF
jgi:hypothetical protein